METTHDYLYANLSRKLGSICQTVWEIMVFRKDCETSEHATILEMFQKWFEDTNTLQIIETKEPVNKQGTVYKPKTQAMESLVI